MGIRVTCPQCGKQLHVKSFLAGKRGVCPECNSKFDIPRQDGHTLEVDEPEGDIAASPAPAASPARPQAASAPVVPSVAPMPVAAAPMAAAPQMVAPQMAATPLAAPQMAAQPVAAPVSMTAQPAMAGSLRDPILEAPNASWYVRHPTAGQFGPAVGNVMQQWLQERRVTGDSLVWREGWTDWQRADLAFAHIFGGAAMPAAATAIPAAAVAAQPVAAMPAGMVPAAAMAAVPTAAVAMGAPMGQMAPAGMGLPGGGGLPDLESPRSSTTAGLAARRRSTNNSLRILALVVLLLAVFVLAPVLGYVLMQQF